MPMHKGSGNNQQAITACGVALKEVYKGSTLVWGNSEPEPPTTVTCYAYNGYTELQIGGTQDESKTLDTTYTLDTNYMYKIGEIPWYSNRATFVIATIAQKIKPLYCQLWFYGFSAMTSIDLSLLNTENCINMNDMFGYCSSVTELDVSGFDTSKVKVMRDMFSWCSALTSLDVSGFDTSNVYDMSAMFNRCSSLTSLDVSEFNVEKVTDISTMFNYCSEIEELDVSQWSTPSLTKLYQMFSNCSKLKYADLSGFDLSGVTDANGLFSSCTMLEDCVLPDMTNVTNIGTMFSYCSTIAVIDLSPCNFTSLTNIRMLFSRCSALTTIYVKVFNADGISGTRGSNVFSNCQKLVGGAGTKFSSSHTNQAYAHIDGGTSNPGYFTEK